MSSKYTPLVDQDSGLPPYELVSYSEQPSPQPLAGASVENSTQDVTPVTPTSDAALPQQPKKTNTLAQSILNFFTVDKAYTFKVKSSLVQDRVFCFKYAPKDGFHNFRSLIVDKIKETTNCSPDEIQPFLVGYVDKRDLITITSDSEFLRYINSHFQNKKSCKKNARRLERQKIELLVYATEEHQKVANTIKSRRCAKALFIIFTIMFMIAFMFSLIH